MSNRPKQRGTAAETATLRWLRDNGFPWTERLTLSGVHDRGDLSLLPGCAVVAEVKNHANAGTGQPTAGQLTGWMAETERERVNAGADHAALIVKRKGTTDVGRWWCYLPLHHLINLAGDNPHHPYRLPEESTLGAHPVCISTAAWVELLRRAGYGHPLDQEGAA